MIKRNYECDLGSLALIHKESNVKVLLSNDYGDGSFDYYILESDEISKIPSKAVKLSLWVETPSDWKILDYDCYNKSSSEGYEFEEKCWGFNVYQHGQTFYFLLLKGDLL
jgi:hypothetical protein